jgi:DNA-binding transcriptional regulator YiaG
MNIPDAENYNPEPNEVRMLIEDCCTKYNYSRNRLAQQIGVSDRTIRYWVSGDKSIPYTAQYALEVLSSEHNHNT